MKFETLLQQRKIDYVEHIHPKTYTAQGLAHEEHISGYIVAKPVIVKAGESFAMCVLPAPKHVDLNRVANLLHQPDVRLATESEMIRLFPDCELGAEPPVGPLYNMKTIMDSALKDDDELVMQAGTHTESIRMRREDWERLAEPVVGFIATG